MTISPIEHKILTLNKSWVPVHITTVRKAIKAVWTYGAKFVDPESYELHDWYGWSQFHPHEDEEGIRASGRRFKIPEVMILSTFNKLPSCIITYNRRNLMLRDSCRCMYCGLQLKSENITVDHVIPRSQGGKSNFTNCVIACRPCNAKKANRTPKEAGMTLINQPVKPKWAPIVQADKMMTKESWKKFLAED